MRTGFFMMCGGLYAAFKTVIYFNSQLESGASLDIVPSDYSNLMRTPNGITALALCGVFNTFLCATYANTYIKKANRYMTGKESRGLPESWALRSSVVGSLTKVVTSNLSAGLTLSWLVEMGMRYRYNPSTAAILSSRVVSILLMNVFTMPSSFYVNYAIGYNEAQNDDELPAIGSKMKRLLQCIDRMCSPGAHAMITNTPSNVMYVIEGSAIATFIARFALGKDIKSYALPSAWVAAVSCINLLFVAAMQIGYDVKYQDEIMLFKPALYPPVAAGYRLANKIDASCTAKLMEKQCQLIDRHNTLINGSSALYTSVIMTAGTFMLVYALAADKSLYDAGGVEWPAFAAAAATAALSIVAGFVADLSFLFESGASSPALPVTATPPESRAMSW
ncbi:MAG: hypothetical protein P1U34_10355 [Coxiellaceae bacterium]|nr:hypothetical protein [Coxiellaceae bacterium]